MPEATERNQAPDGIANELSPQAPALPEASPLGGLTCPLGPNSLGTRTHHHSAMAAP